ncbi:MAG TPA: GntR family transcriptional regulator [Solirubrobacteraceae bacterium]|nr:GntR family transcriptional regulator [Solirubrobacteraceae bacterium]
MHALAAKRMQDLFADGWTLDRDSGEPAYAQLESRIAFLVSSGQIEIGARVPSERDLADWTGVSRPTARAALSSLARSGMLERGIGRRGTRVAANALVRDGGDFSGFTGLARRDGIEPEAQVLSVTCMPADARVAAPLALGAGDPVWHLQRLRVGAAGPCTFEESWLPAERFADLDRLDLSGSIYALLDDRFASRPVRAAERLEPIGADAVMAGALGVAVGAPLMLVEHTSYGASGAPLEHARDVHRPDRATFVVDVTVAAR